VAMTEVLIYFFVSVDLDVTQYQFVLLEALANYDLKKIWEALGSIFLKKFVYWPQLRQSYIGVDIKIFERFLIKEIEQGNDQTILSAP
jgi:hypothetical protein